MKNRYALLFVLFITLVNSGSVYAQTFSRKPSWTQEFSGLRKRPLKDWKFLVQNYPTGDAYFTDSLGNVFIKKGKLHLRATADRRMDKVCSSGYVSTKGYKSFLYGKIEVRAKIPIGAGIIPAIWMLREDHWTVWPLGEIDIMEYIACYEKKEFATTIHLLYREEGSKETPIEYRHGQHKTTDLSKYHIYGLEWTPDQLTFTLDHKPYYSFTPKDAEYWPFNDPYILILSLGYGGWGGACGMDNTIFPTEMLIDWIRYYPLLDN